MDVDEITRLPLLTAYVAMLVATLGHFFISTSLFIKRRHHFPINGHGHGLIILIQIAIAEQNAALSIWGILDNNVPCFTILIFTSGAFTLAVNCFVGRAFRVWYYYKAAEERLSVKTSFLTPKKSEERWFANHAHWFAERRLMTLAFGISLLQTVAVILYFMGRENDFEVLMSENRCRSILESLYVSQGTIGMSLVPVIFITWRLRKVHDGYGIKQDLGWGAIGGLFQLVTVALRTRIPTLIFAFLWFGGTHFLIFVGCTKKVIRSYVDDGAYVRRLRKQFDKQRKEAIARQEENLVNRPPVYPWRIEDFTLDFVLQTPKLLPDFTEHLKREFSVENLVFYQAASDFKERCWASDGFSSTTERNARAMEIYREFIVDGAPSEVNISFKDRRVIIDKMKPFTITNVMEPMTPRHSLSEPFYRHENDTSGKEREQPVPFDVFESGAKKVFALMKSDSFVRFKVAYIKKFRKQMPHAPLSEIVPKRTAACSTPNVDSLERGLSPTTRSMVVGVPALAPISLSTRTDEVAKV